MPRDPGSRNVRVGRAKHGPAIHKRRRGGPAAEATSAHPAGPRHRTAFTAGGFHDPFRIVGSFSFGQ